MTTDTWEPQPVGKDYLTSEEVCELAGVRRVSLYNWIDAGLLPRPRTTRGRGIISKWPLVTSPIAKFIRSQRELGFALSEIRPRLIEAFGERVLEVVAKPKPKKKRKNAGAPKK